MYILHFCTNKQNCISQLYLISIKYCIFRPLIKSGLAQVKDVLHPGPLLIRIYVPSAMAKLLINSS